MDLSTVLGLIFTAIVLLAGISYGGPLVAFADVPSTLIVILGTSCSIAVCFPPTSLKSIWSVTKKALTFTPRDPKALLSTLQEMSNRARREGTLSLEEFITQIEDDFFARGIQLVVDGHEPQAIEDMMYTEIDKINERHAHGVEIFETIGMLAPAFGMIGTLIGLVHMLRQMDDPTKIGPAMAVALLTTLYGSLIANCFAIPMSKKLKIRSEEESQEKQLIAKGILSILARESPRFLVERLNVQLPPSERVEAG